MLNLDEKCKVLTDIINAELMNRGLAVRAEVCTNVPRMGFFFDFFYGRNEKYRRYIHSCDIYEWDVVSLTKLVSEIIDSAPFTQLPTFHYEYAKNATVIKSITPRRKTKCMDIEKVIFNNPATIVLWKDGTKTVVKSQPGDVFDEEKGLAMAISKRALGTNKSGGNYYEQFRLWGKG